MSGAGAPPGEPTAGGGPPDGTIDGEAYVMVGNHLMQAAQRLTAGEARPDDKIPRYRGSWHSQNIRGFIMCSLEMFASLCRVDSES